MKKNFLMWTITIIAAFLGFIIAVVSFFKNKHFLWSCKDEHDVFDGLEDDIVKKVEKIENDVAKNADDIVVENVAGEEAAKVSVSEDESEIDVDKIIDLDEN